MVYKAIWNGQVIAEAQKDECEIVEGNVYFPPQSVKKEFFSDSDDHTVCSWKGTASYYDVKVGDNVNASAAWYYPEPSDAAKNIRNYVAFWKGVEIKEE